MHAGGPSNGVCVFVFVLVLGTHPSVLIGCATELHKSRVYLHALDDAAALLWQRPKGRYLEGLRSRLDGVEKDPTCLPVSVRSKLGDATQSANARCRAWLNWPIITTNREPTSAGVEHVLADTSIRVQPWAPFFSIDNTRRVLNSQRGMLGRDCARTTSMTS
jgi:hypothetical protein